MKIPAVRHLKSSIDFKYNNKNYFVDLIAEKLSGFGVYICKSAAKGLTGYGQDFGCIFIKRKI